MTAALSLMLMALGAGMGLSSISPWPHAGISAPRAAPLALVWIMIVQFLACAVGGYVAGRLRTKWVAVHTHEVYFRDTAHGLLVWAVSLVMTVAFLSALATSLATDLSNMTGEGATKSGDYFVDSLFRGNRSVGENFQPTREEARAILVKALSDATMDPADRAYLASLVSARTGISESEAAARVDRTLTAEREAIDRARKAVAHSLYWLVVALLIGAFCGSYAAIIGGRRRDHVWT